jgi:hypothetical protein
MDAASGHHSLRDRARHEICERASQIVSRRDLPNLAGALRHRVCDEGKGDERMDMIWRRLHEEQ